MIARLRRLAAADHRHPRYQAHFAALPGSLGPAGLCLAVGGGPTRAHRRLTNLSIAPLANIEVVGDAHALPFAAGRLGGIHREAVLEHPEDPDGGSRPGRGGDVPRPPPGGLVLAATSFPQAFHG